MFVHKNTLDNAHQLAVEFSARGAVSLRGGLIKIAFKNLAKFLLQSASAVQHRSVACTESMMILVQMSE